VSIASPIAENNNLLPAIFASIINESSNTVHNTMQLMLTCKPAYSAGSFFPRGENHEK